MHIMAPHKPTPDHLAAVTAEMRTLGAPAIRCVWIEDVGEWLAVEGSHRLAAAAALGLTPTIVEVDPADEIEHDFDDVPERTVAAVVAYLERYGLNSCPSHAFDD